jgi:hypothetical protein
MPDSDMDREEMNLGEIRRPLNLEEETGKRGAKPESNQLRDTEQSLIS